MSCYRIDVVATVLIFCLVCTRVGSFAQWYQEQSNPLRICEGGEAQISASSETRFSRILLQSARSKVTVLGSSIASFPASHKEKVELPEAQHPLSSFSSLRKSPLGAHIIFPNYTYRAVSTKQPEDAQNDILIAQKIVGYTPEPEITTDLNQSVVPQQEEEIAKIKKSLHIAVAIMLLGFVSFVMALFYLVNFPDEDIQGATWRLLSATMSIFLAVLMFSGTQHFMSFVTGTSYRYGHEREELSVAIGHGEVTRDIIVFSFARFLFFWVVLQLYMYFVHGRSHTLKAIAKLGSHIVAFAGMDAFGTLQEEGVFAGNLLHSLVGVSMLGIIIWVLFDLADILRSHLVKNSSDPEARQEWLSLCNSAQHETAALILGLLLSQCIRFAITGSLPPLEGGSPRGKSRSQVHTLFAVAICLGMLVVPLEMILNNLSTFAAEFGPDRAWNRGWTTRFLRVMRETVSMTMAWCLTYWGRWAFWMSTGDSGLGYGDKMTALLATSLFMSAFCFGAILAIDFLADRVVGEKSLAGLIALGNSMGLVLGLAWESTFHEAVGAIGEIHLFPVGYELNVLVLILAFVAVTLPAWMIYILPEAMKNRGEGCHWTEEDNEY